MAEEQANQHMTCMEVWGGSQLTARGVELGGLDAWVYSKPYGNAGRGGDVYYASSCATGRISRLLLADVSGHGEAVAATAGDLRKLMRRYVNVLNQREFVRSLNRQFVVLSDEQCFATAIATTYFAPTRRLSICNAGHPRPFLYRVASRQWSILEQAEEDSPSPRNIPLGILDITDYEQFDIELDVGDLVLCYTDALIESRGADGEFLGEGGLLEIVRSLDAEKSSAFIDSLIGEIARGYPGNLTGDDATVLLLRVNALGPRVSWREKLGAAARFARAVARGVNPRAERPPLPDMNLANIGGAIFPGLGKRWRPATDKGGRPTRHVSR